MKCDMLRPLVIVTAGVFTLAAATAAAQPPPGGGQGGGPRYDTATEITVTGTVAEVQSHEGRGAGTGTHLMLTTPGGQLDVHVGPTSWLTGKHFTFAKGDQLTVVGSKVAIDGKDNIIAREIKRGTDTMMLRNEKGIPLWSQGRR